MSATDRDRPPPDRRRHRASCTPTAQRIPMLTAVRLPDRPDPRRGRHPDAPRRRFARPGRCSATSRPSASRWPRWSTTPRPSSAARRAHWSSADMPFLSYATPDEALENAGTFLREAGAQAVKVEGGVRSARIIEALVRAGIPVMGHIGLTPQSINTLAARSASRARPASRPARSSPTRSPSRRPAPSAMVLELVPEQLAAAITERLRVPTIGIGAGAGLQRPGPGRDRPHRPRRLRAASTPGRMPTSGGDRRSGLGICRRRRGRDLPRARGDRPDGRLGPR